MVVQDAPLGQGELVSEGFIGGLVATHGLGKAVSVGRGGVSKVPNLAYKGNQAPTFQAKMGHPGPKSLAAVVVAPGVLQVSGRAERGGGAAEKGGAAEVDVAPIPDLAVVVAQDPEVVGAIEDHLVARRDQLHFVPTQQHQGLLWAAW